MGLNYEEKRKQLNAARNILNGIYCIDNHYFFDCLNEIDRMLKIIEQQEVSSKR